MSSAFWTMLHLGLTFSVATYILWTWRRLMLLLPLAFTSLWPLFFIFTAISDPNRPLGDGINLFAWILNPIVQAWIYKFIQSKLAKAGK